MGLRPVRAPTAAATLGSRARETRALSLSVAGSVMRRRSGSPRAEGCRRRRSTVYDDASLWKRPGPRWMLSSVTDFPARSAYPTSTSVSKLATGSILSWMVANRDLLRCHRAVERHAELTRQPPAWLSRGAVVTLSGDERTAARPAPTCGRCPRRGCRRPRTPRRPPGSCRARWRGCEPVGSRRRPNTWKPRRSVLPW